MSSEQQAVEEIEGALPETCDLCPIPLTPGDGYRRVQFVIDAVDSVVGERPADVENGFHLVLCSRCAKRAEDLLVPSENQMTERTLATAQLLTAAVVGTGPMDSSFEAVSADDFDEEDLERQAEKEAFILQEIQGALAPWEATRKGAAPRKRESEVVSETADTELKTPLFGGCCSCHRRRTQVGASTVAVSWRCSVCRQLVCPDCTLTIPGSVPMEYFERTLCSEECWRKAGCPSE